MRWISAGEEIEHVEELGRRVIVLEGIASYPRFDEPEGGKECREGLHLDQIRKDWTCRSTNDYTNREAI